MGIDKTENCIYYNSVINFTHYTALGCTSLGIREAPNPRAFYLGGTYENSNFS